nr:hypothetical protein [Candidatus Sigynarchaeota archaeon]
MPRLVPIRICSPRKSTVARGHLDEIYVCHMLKAFFHAFDATGYAVLSRKLGICWSGIKYDNYGDWEEKGDDQIRAMLAEQARDPAMANTCFVYWNHRPLTNDKWVKMLAGAGFKVIERRTLGEIKARIAGQAQASLDSWTAAPGAKGET